MCGLNFQFPLRVAPFLRIHFFKRNYRFSKQKLLRKVVTILQDMRIWRHNNVCTYYMLVAFRDSDDIV